MSVQPLVAVLMATFNGRLWIDAQIESILLQDGVTVDIYISDDLSSDGTSYLIESFENTHENIKVLRPQASFGSAGKNFYHLITSVNPEKYDYVAFCDQDDIWQRDKLVRHIHLVQQYDVDGVSSNVIAFWPDGRQKFLNKSQPQRQFDYLFESAGPGCSFLMRSSLIKKVRAVLNDATGVATSVSLHDWLTYAVCRASGGRWYIDDRPSLLYRQHANNVLGANHGWGSAWTRIRKMRSGWYRDEVGKIVSISYALSGSRDIKAFSDALSSCKVNRKLITIRMAWQGRRSLRDRLVLIMMIMLGLF